MSAPVRFAHISDTHIKPEGIDRSQRFADVLAEIQAGDYDFVIHTGDLMDEPSAWAARAFKAICSPVQIPIYVVPGNHDVYNPPMGDVEAPWWAKLEVNSCLEAQYEGWFGAAWYSVSCRGVHLVGMNSLILNSGLPEEAEQWAWLEETLKELGGLDEKVVLFTHLPLFINEPDERLDVHDFANRYLVIAPPGRERLLGLVRQHRVTAVFSGHIHAPWQKVHTWSEGFSTQFVCTGSSGEPSAMAINQFDLPLSPEEGLGYHEHWLTGEGLTSRYHRHTPRTREGRWTLGPAWTSLCGEGRMPSMQEGHQWYDTAYRPVTPEWQELVPAARFSLDSGDAGALCVRQTFEAEAEAAALYLELLTERALELYLNGELVCKLDALNERPPAWQSAGGTYSIHSPLLHLGLNQRLVHRGQNALALHVDGRSRAGRDAPEYIAYRYLGRE
jgi:3',5'-cyclic AMP phosphodiesterase CpdA